MCRIFGIHILNGRFSGDHDGENTFSARSGNSVVDYMLASSSLFTLVQQFRIEPMTESDHFPLACELLCNVIHRDPLNVQSAVRPFCRYKWNSTKRDGFLEKLTDEPAKHLIEKSINALARNSVNQSVSICLELLQRAAKEMKCIPRTGIAHPGTSRRSADWWDDDCDRLR